MEHQRTNRPPDNFNSSYLEHQWTNSPPLNLNCIKSSLTTSGTSTDQQPPIQL